MAKLLKADPKVESKLADAFEEGYNTALDDSFNEHSYKSHQLLGEIVVDRNWLDSLKRANPNSKVTFDLGQTYEVYDAVLGNDDSTGAFGAFTPGHLGIVLIPKE